MKAFLITPDHENHRAVLTVAEVEQNASGDARLQHLYQLLDCRYVQIVEPLPGSALDGHVLIVDEDGLSQRHAGFIFMPKIYPTPLAGKILVLAQRQSAEGDVMASVTATEAEVHALISCAYCSPAYAKAAMKLQEDTIRRQYPGVIVVPASNSIHP